MKNYDDMNLTEFFVDLVGRKHEEVEEILEKTLLKPKAVEIVRCGECIHSKERKIKDTVICTKYNAYKDINGFCEAGERK